MPNRKIPFSSKQKKQQLQEKREKKKHLGADSDEEENVLEEDKIISVDSSGQAVDTQNSSKTVPVARMNQQPGQHGKPKPDRKDLKSCYDPNRYRLHFFRESKEELKARKERACLPITPAGEKALEMSLEEIYRPGSELDMPKRPPWDYNMSRDELDQQEQQYFRNYVEKIFAAHGNTEDLSYFELNLETWRQLWRVMEMSDVFLVIVDLRFPVLHFPPTVYKYLNDVLHKPVILILNKIDLVPVSLAIAWKKYFESVYPALNVILFGSAPRAAVDFEQTFKKKKPTKMNKYQVSYGVQEIFDVCQKLTEGKVDMKHWRNRLEGRTVSEKPFHSADASDPNTPHIPFKDGVLTIGCIGEPNVGKSSVINALMGHKVVSVSRTPGHTKHFQTIFLAPNVRLCDCPGLVFPATAPKVLQILGGIYPIAQVSDPYNVVGYLAARVPLIKLLKLKHADDQNTNGIFSALDVCESWALKRGFLTAKAARPDVYRAANHLLRVTLEGRICLRMYPPGFTEKKAVFEAMPETRELAKKLGELEAKFAAKPSLEESEGSGDETGMTEEESDEDTKLGFERAAAKNKFAALAMGAD